MEVSRAARSLAVVIAREGTTLTPPRHPRDPRAGMHLEPCAACARHVRADSAACPFCDAPMTARFASVTVAPEALSRREILALGASLAALGCRASRGFDTSQVQPYGAPIPVQPDVAVQGNDPGAAIVAPYGAPPRPSSVVWSLSASATRLTLAARTDWRLRVDARNTGDLPTDAGRTPLMFRVNGDPSPIANLAFGNGTREARWSSLPPGESVRDERALGEALFARPGRYEIALDIDGREASRVVVEVTGR